MEDQNITIDLPDDYRIPDVDENLIEDLISEQETDRQFRIDSGCIANETVDFDLE